MLSAISFQTIWWWLYPVISSLFDLTRQKYKTLRIWTYNCTYICSTSSRNYFVHIAPCKNINHMMNALKWKLPLKWKQNFYFKFLAVNNSPRPWKLLQSWVRPRSVQSIQEKGIVTICVCGKRKDLISLKSEYCVIQIVYQQLQNTQSSKRCKWRYKQLWRLLAGGAEDNAGNVISSERIYSFKQWTLSLGNHWWWRRVYSISTENSFQCRVDKPGKN